MQETIKIISSKVTEMPAITEVFGFELPNSKPAYLAREIIYTIVGREAEGARSVVVEDLTRSEASIIASIIASLSDSDGEADAELRDETGVDY